MPAGLTPVDPAWIDHIAVGPDGIPILEIRGPVGVVVDVEVSGDLSLWDFLETVTIGDEGVIVCPDPDRQDITKGFYRLVLP